MTRTALIVTDVVNTYEHEDAHLLLLRMMERNMSAAIRTSADPGLPF